MASSNSVIDETDTCDDEGNVNESVNWPVEICSKAN